MITGLFSSLLDSYDRSEVDTEQLYEGMDNHEYGGIVSEIGLDNFLEHISG